MEAAAAPIRRSFLPFFPKNQGSPIRLPLRSAQIARIEIEAPPMAKVLLLRSSDGKVLVAPTWDYRPSAAQALPLEIGVPSRALERVLQFWTKHDLAKASGESRESLARWQADFERRLEEDGLTTEAAAAVRQFRLYGVHHGGRRLTASSASRPHAATPSDVADPAAAARAAAADPVRVWCRPVPQRRLSGVHHGERRPGVSSTSHARAATPSDVAAAARADLAVAWCAAARAEPATTLRAAGADPVDVWCAIHARAEVSPDRAAASRAHGRQRAEDEESACHHRKRPVTISRPVTSRACSSVGSAQAAPCLPALAAAPVKNVTATGQLHPSKPAASSLRARRALPELSCKCPQQNPLVAASRKQPA